MIRAKKHLLPALAALSALLLFGCGPAPGPADQSAGQPPAETASPAPSAAAPDVSAARPPAPDADGYYPLCSEDGQTSVELRLPPGFEALKYTTETWLDFSKSGEGSTVSMVACLRAQSAAQAEADMREEVQATAALNQAAESELGELCTLAAGTRELTGFHYSITTPATVIEGFRLWMPLNSDCTLLIILENTGPGIGTMTEQYAAELLQQAGGRL